MTQDAIAELNQTGGLGGQTAGPNAANTRLSREPQKLLTKLNELGSEFCSSILVKETRQALKSRQFIWSYCLLLLCVGIWTIMGLTLSAELSGVNYRAGQALLCGFWVILGFPLGLIIPFGAYRSLAREFEDGTIQLISITTMKPYQIVMGKFGSALLQMIIYLSVLAPCILFTYMLRGVNISQISIGLIICVGGSICLTIVGLFLAGAVQSRALGIGISVLFVLFLGWLYYFWCVLSIELTSYGQSIDWSNPEFTAIVFNFVAILGSLAILLLVTAASQISFPSDNRSTPIRVAMLIQQMLFFAAIIASLPMVYYFDLEGFSFGMTLVIGHYWLVMGLLVSGEKSTMSRRVQRSLPRSLFSRSLFSLLMPGSGRGFLFVIANLWTSSLLLILAFSFPELLMSRDSLEPGGAVGNGFFTQPNALPFESIAATLASAGFVTCFLSLVFLAMRLFFKKRIIDWPSGVGPLISLIMGSLFVALSMIGSWSMHYSMVDYSDRSNTSIWMVPNWYWAVFDISEGSSYLTQLVAVGLLAVLAQLVIVIAILVASRDLLSKPIAVPERVKIEQQRAPKQLAKGESIDEIFGILPPGPEAG